MAASYDWNPVIAGATLGSSVGIVGTIAGAIAGGLYSLSKYQSDKSDSYALNKLTDEEYNNSIASYNLQLKSDKLELTDKKIQVASALDSVALQQSEIGYQKDNYESFLDWFGGTSKAAELGGASLADATPNAESKTATRAAFEEVWNNYAVNDVVAGSTGRIGGAETSMGQTALAALDTLKGVVTTSQAQLKVYNDSLASLAVSKTSLEATLGQINDLLTSDELNPRDTVAAVTTDSSTPATDVNPADKADKADSSTPAASDPNTGDTRNGADGLEVFDGVSWVKQSDKNPTVGTTPAGNKIGDTMPSPSGGTLLWDGHNWVDQSSKTPEIGATMPGPNGTLVYTKDGWTDSTTATAALAGGGSIENTAATAAAAVLSARTYNGVVYPTADAAEAMRQYDDGGHGADNGHEPGSVDEGSDYSRYGAGSSTYSGGHSRED